MRRLLAVQLRVVRLVKYIHAINRQVSVEADRRSDRTRGQK